MKAKKALKRLHRAEELLGDVIEQYKEASTELHTLLDGAKASLASAAQTLAEPPAKKPAANAGPAQSPKSSPAAPKKAKKRGTTGLAKAAGKTA